MPIIKCLKCGLRFATKKAFERHFDADKKCNTFKKFEANKMDEKKQIEQAQDKAGKKIEHPKPRFIIIVTVIDKITGKVLDVSDYEAFSNTPK